MRFAFFKNYVFIYSFISSFLGSQNLKIENTESMNPRKRTVISDTTHSKFVDEVNAGKYVLKDEIKRPRINESNSPGDSHTSVYVEKKDNRGCICQLSYDKESEDFYYRTYFQCDFCKNNIYCVSK